MSTPSYSCVQLLNMSTRVQWCSGRRMDGLTLVCAADEKLDQTADLLHLMLPVGLGDGRDVGFGRLHGFRLLLQVLLQEPGRNTRHEEGRPTAQWKVHETLKCVQNAPEHSIPGELLGILDWGYAVQFLDGLAWSQKPLEALHLLLLRNMTQRGELMFQERLCW